MWYHSVPKCDKEHRVALNGQTRCGSGGTVKMSSVDMCLHLQGSGGGGSPPAVSPGPRTPSPQPVTADVPLLSRSSV